jgi:hypothetical protein
MLEVQTVDMSGLLVCQLAGELTATDLALEGSAPKGSEPSPLKRIGARHHAVAKALAEGMRPGIVAATYNYSLSRISILQSDPTFQELVEHYRAEVNYDYARTRERLVALGDAADAIAERLENEDQRKEISTGLLVKIVEATADRTGHGKKTEADINLNVGFADRLRNARERIANESRLIEGTVNDG